MGAEESTEHQEEWDNIRRQYVMVKEITHRTLGEIALLKHQATGELVGIKNAQANSDEEQIDFVEKFRVRSQLSHNNIATIKAMNVRSEDALCGSFHKIEIMFEYYDYDLLKDIAARASTDQFYTTQEMWNISASISEGLAYLQDNRIPHQDVQPENVLLNVNGTIKMGDYGLITGGLTGYYKLLSGKT